MPVNIHALADKLGLVPQNVKYKPPAIDKNGFIEFDLDGKHLSSEIILADNNSIGQWNADKNKRIVYLDPHIAIKDIPVLAVHEVCEQHFQKDMGIDWRKGGHNLSQICEHAYARTRENEQSWDIYNKDVARIAHMEGSELGISRLAALMAMKIYSRKR